MAGFIIVKILLLAFRTAALAAFFAGKEVMLEVRVLDHFVARGNIRTVELQFAQLFGHTNAFLLPDGVSGATVWASLTLSGVLVDALLAECLFAFEAVSWVLHQVQTDHTCQAIVIA